MGYRRGGQRGLKMPTNGQQNGHVSATFMQLLHGGLKMLSESKGGSGVATGGGGTDFIYEKYFHV